MCTLFYQNEETRSVYDAETEPADFIRRFEYAYRASLEGRALTPAELAEVQHLSEPQLRAAVEAAQEDLQMGYDGGEGQWGINEIWGDEGAEGEINAPQLSELRGTGKIGDFLDIKGKSIEEIISRVPKKANMRVLWPVSGKVQRGVEFSWKMGGKTIRVRIHDSDLSAPVGSNASKGWIVRIQEGKKYMDPETGIFQPPGITNPDSPFYDPRLGDSTHIPIQTPTEEIINELIRRD